MSHPNGNRERKQMYQKFLRTLLFALLMVAPAVASTEVKPNSVREVSSTASASPVSQLDWMTDYATAMHRAKAEGQMLLIAFCGNDTEDFKACLAPDVLDDPEVQKQLESFLLLKLPNDVCVDLGKEKGVELLKHSTFREMCGTSGIAMIDFRNKGAKYYGHVVSTFPIMGGKPYTKSKFLTILGLPAGTLTQRTLIYAVRIHPESPKSTDGDLSEYLTSEALASSAYQAKIRLQGHHNWESRFHRISGRLPSGLQATEVWCRELAERRSLESSHRMRPDAGTIPPAIGARLTVSTVSGATTCAAVQNRIWYATGIF